MKKAWAILFILMLVFALLNGCGRRRPRRNIVSQPPPASRPATPEEREAIRCRMLCKQLKNQCLQLEVEEAKQYMVFTRHYELFLDKSQCNREYNRCIKECSGEIETPWYQ